VYLEAIFSPTERLPLGVSLEENFEGFCDGVQAAREQLGIEVRLTPDITRFVALDVACEMAEYAVRYRDRGIVGIGLGGPEVGYPPEPYERAFAIARDGGVASVPHAGETEGPASIRGALDALQADRIRHGVRAVEDAGLLRELADRGIVLDVCVLSNVCLSVVPSVAAHQLPQLLEAGVLCTANTDDPTFFACDLEAEHAAARSLGADPRALFDAGVAGALCDEAVKDALRALGAAHDWDAAPTPAS
jgi:aminodeoxyfutalosine deaminase